MICPKCGKENAEKMRFCSQCGSSLTGNGPESTNDRGGAECAPAVGAAISSGGAYTEPKNYVVDIGHSLLDTQFVGMRNLIRQKKAEK